MKLQEIFESKGISADEKARRVLNTSTLKANITASEIEDGVTIERLGEIGVPVYRYSTQVTIHGVLPGFSEAAPWAAQANAGENPAKPKECTFKDGFNGLVSVGSLREIHPELPRQTEAGKHARSSRAGVSALA